MSRRSRKRAMLQKERQQQMEKERAKAEKKAAKAINAELKTSVEPVTAGKKDLLRFVMSNGGTYLVLAAIVLPIPDFRAVIALHAGILIAMVVELCIRLCRMLRLPDENTVLSEIPECGDENSK